MRTTMADLADALRDVLLPLVAEEVERAFAELRTEPEREWLTAEQAADWLSVPKKRIYTKPIPGRVKHDGRVLFHAPTVRRWLLDGKPPGAPTEADRGGR
jgi:hypothetical protein